MHLRTALNYFDLLPGGSLKWTNVKQTIFYVLVMIHLNPVCYSTILSSLSIILRISNLILRIQIFSLQIQAVSLPIILNRFDVFLKGI